MPPSVKPIVSRLPTREAQLKTIEYAITPIDGKLPTRDRVAMFASRFRGKKDALRRLKPLKAKVNGRTISFEIRPGESVEAVLKDAKYLAASLQKHREHPAEALEFLLR